jgi:GNAT superfamily N-acetyltransferase
MITLRRCTSANHDFRNLLPLLDADLESRYGELQVQYNSLNILEAIDTVVVAYQGDDPVGCGCYKPYDAETVEIKRIFVKRENRGAGIARTILAELERWAMERGYKRSVLETGIQQPEAIHVYEKADYGKIENYGPYAGNPNSICLCKLLSIPME